jgi:hypothetical protein
MKLDGASGPRYAILSMRWEEWLDIDTIRACVRHATGAVPALLIFALVGLVIHYIISDDTLRLALETIDGLALVGLFVWLVYQMGCILWNRREKIGRGLHVLVA